MSETFLYNLSASSTICNDEEVSDLYGSVSRGDNRNLNVMRILSLLIAIAYLVIGCLQARSAKEVFATLLILSGALLLPLACIWFADELGEYVGSVPGPAINRKSPAWMVKIGGWILLFLPVIVFLLTYKS